MLRPSSTLRAGSQNPAPSCLSNLAEVVSAAAPQTTKKNSLQKIHMLALQVLVSVRYPGLPIRLKSCLRLALQTQVVHSTTNSQ